MVASLSPGSARAICPGAELLKHHDDSFEFADGWSYGLERPDYGSFAEGFAGNGTVCGFAVYLTSTNFNAAEPDCYVWTSEGGNPGAVLAVVPGVQMGSVKIWPDFSRKEVEIEASVAGDFFVGLWPMFSDWPIFVCADGDGSQGTPRTKVPPGQEWTAGWHDVNDIWPDGVNSMGLEVYFYPEATLTTTKTWGGVKALFRR